MAVLETRTDVEGRVAVLTLNRPDARNALSIELCDAISQAIDELEDDSDVRAIVFRGEGKVFCSGADFSAIAGQGALEFLPAFERMLERVARVKHPTIAAIHGAALGGGLQLATVCDFRIAGSDTKLGIPSSRIGIVVNFENVQRLVHLAGSAVAKEVLMTGRTFTADSLVGQRLVTTTIDPRRVLDEAMTLASELAALAPLSVQGAKRSIQQVLDHLSGARITDAAGVDHIDELVRKAYESWDLAEGLRAMAEKREPGFRGI
jgi:enoyl-CoA hydratase/carnithine racemase